MSGSVSSIPLKNSNGPGGCECAGYAVEAECGDEPSGPYSV